MTNKGYLAVALGLAGVLFLVVVSINYFADPIGIYHPPLIKGFNDSSPAATAYARIEKTEAIKRLKPDAIIIGSSRADIGLDPRPEYFPGMTPYNAGLSAATIHENRMMLEFAQAVHPLKEAVITLDFFSFDGHRLENKQFEPERLTPQALTPLHSFFYTYGTIVSFDTLIASFKNIRYLKHLDRHAYSEPNGHKINNDVVDNIAAHGAAHMFDAPPADREISVDDFSFDYAGGQDNSVFNHLEAMLDFARQNKIKVVLLLSPVHEGYMKHIEEQGRGALAEEWKKRVTEIVRANAARYGEKPYPLWDFAYRNSFTTEPVPAAGDLKTHMKWWWDPSHYKVELGDIVLRKVLGLPGGHQYPGFGRKIF